MEAKCPECNSIGKLGDELAGKQVRCPRCGSKFVAVANRQLKWHYAEGANKVGPFDQEHFDSLIEDGTIAPDTMVWSKGMAGWQPLIEVRPFVLQNKWYYASDNNKVGPLAQDQFDTLVDDGTITPDSMVWGSGMAGWQTLSEFQSAQGFEVCGGCQGNYSSVLMQDCDGVRICKSCKLLLNRETGPDLEYGNLGSRLIAKIIDLIFMLALAGIIEGLSRKLFPGSYTLDTVSPVVVVTVLINMLLGIFYVTWFVGKLGATPGKMIVKLKITDPSGGKIGYGHAFGRYCGEYIAALGMMVCFSLLIFWAISSIYPANQMLLTMSLAVFITFAMVYAPALFDPQRRTLYDRFCNTRVLAA